MRILLLDARKNSKDEFQRTKNDGEHAVSPRSVGSEGDLIYEECHCNA
jgi:hypothetical protein